MHIDSSSARVEQDSEELSHGLKRGGPVFWYAGVDPVPLHEHFCSDLTLHDVCAFLVGGRDSFSGQNCATVQPVRVTTVLEMCKEYACLRFLVHVYLIVLCSSSCLCLPIHCNVSLQQ